MQHRPDVQGSYPAPNYSLEHVWVLLLHINLWRGHCCFPARTVYSSPSLWLSKPNSWHALIANQQNLCHPNQEDATLLTVVQCHTLARHILTHPCPTHNRNTAPTIPQHQYTNHHYSCDPRVCPVCMAMSMHPLTPTKCAAPHSSCAQSMKADKMLQGPTNQATQ